MNAHDALSALSACVWLWFLADTCVPHISRQTITVSWCAGRVWQRYA